MQYDTLVILNLLNSLIEKKKRKFSLFGLSDQIPRGQSITLLRSLYIDTILTQYILWSSNSDLEC